MACEGHSHNAARSTVWRLLRKLRTAPTQSDQMVLGRTVVQGPRRGFWITSRLDVRRGCCETGGEIEFATAVRHTRGTFAARSTDHKGTTETRVEHDRNTGSHSVTSTHKQTPLELTELAHYSLDHSSCACVRVCVCLVTCVYKKLLRVNGNVDIMTFVNSHFDIITIVKRKGKSKCKCALDSGCESSCQGTCHCECGC